MHNAPFWQTSALWTTLIGVTTGFALAVGKEKLDRRKRLRAHWAALRAEVHYCEHVAEIYLKDSVIAPLYRLPQVAYENSFPALLADGRLTEAEVRAAIEFFVEVASLNRGLDLAQGARERNDTLALDQEYNRNRGKAANLVVGDNGKRTYFDNLNQILTKHI